MFGLLGVLVYVWFGGCSDLFRFVLIIWCEVWFVCYDVYLGCFSVNSVGVIVSLQDCLFLFVDNDCFSIWYVW